jgi:DNA-binding PadR family transcriptional regulator
MEDLNLSRDLFLGFIKLHILHHSESEDVFGLEMIQELAHHGYAMSPGTMYPLLHRMEKAGLLSSRSELFSGKIRKYYRITEKGKDILAVGYKQAVELINELKKSTRRKGK